MSRFVTSLFATIVLASGTGAASAPPQQQSSTQVLRQGLQAIVQSVVSGSREQQSSAPGQPLTAQAQSGDPDQGDDHASDVAILVVCSHDNPSAQRAAICPRPNSPP